MPGKRTGVEYKTNIVCVDGCEGGELQGRFYAGRHAQERTFASLAQLLRELEAVPEDGPPPKVLRPFEGPPRTEKREGRLATFSLRILFRQNASWQGYVTWKEGGAEQSFRSALELIFLMDSALGHLDRGA